MPRANPATAAALTLQDVPIPAKRKPSVQNGYNERAGGAPPGLLPAAATTRDTVRLQGHTADCEPTAAGSTADGTDDGRCTEPTRKMQHSTIPAVPHPSWFSLNESSCVRV